MKKLVFFIFSSVAVFLVTLFFRLGGHKDVSLQVIDSPSLRILYKKHQGPYHTINSTITEVEAWAAAHQVACPQAFGLYLDNPQTVEERHLRSEGGCVVTGIDPRSLPALPTGLAVREITATKVVQALFSGAPSIGPMKVYPKAFDFIAANGLLSDGTTLEIYTTNSKHDATTEFWFFLKSP
jgi:AraC family transcriptional regulator